MRAHAVARGARDARDLESKGSSIASHARPIEPWPRIRTCRP